MYLALSIPVLLLFLFAWIKFAFKNKAMAVLIVVVFYEKLFLVTDLGIGSRLISDIALALMLPIILMGAKRVGKGFFGNKRGYYWLVITFILIVVLSVIGSSWMIFGQPVSVGLVASRKYFFIISFFYLVALGLDGKELMRLFRYLAYTGAFIALLLIIEAFLLDAGTIFSQFYDIGKTRGDYLRIHVATFLVVYSTMYLWISLDFLTSRRTRMVYLFAVFVCFLSLLFVIQTRAIIIGLAVSMIWYQLRNMDNKKLAITGSVLWIVLVGIAFTGVDYLIHETHIGTIAKETLIEIGGDKGNVSIRKEGFLYYIDYVLVHSPFLGLGFFSDINYPDNPVSYAAERFSYFPVAINGATTYIFFGVPGLIFLVYLTYRMFRDVLKARKRPFKSERLVALVIFHVLIYIVLIPTIGNVLTENILFYTGIFIYFLGGYYLRYTSGVSRAQLSDFKSNPVAPVNFLHSSRLG